MAVPAEETDDPTADRGEGKRGRAGTLFIVRDAEGRILKVLHSMRGRVTGFDPALLDDLERARAEYRAIRCVVLREGVLDELVERVALRLQRGDDYLTQWLVMLKAARELEEAGLIEVHPRPLGSVPVPTPGTVRRALDLVLPDDHSMVATLWDRGTIWTAAALRRRAGSIDLVAGPDLVARFTGPLGGDWRRDYRVIADAVERSVAPVHLGVFAEADTVRELLRSPDPGAWARAVAVRDVILHPTPPYVAVALGADAVRAVAATSARLLGGVDFLGAFAPVTQYLRSRVQELTSVTQTLGFNPLRVLAAALRRAEGRTDDEQEEHA
jgi:hypothetical protein